MNSGSDNEIVVGVEVRGEVVVDEFERAPLKFILLIITWAPEQEISGLFIKK